MTTQEIETRFESLERGMRRWRRLASVLVVGLVVAGTVAATRQEEKKQSPVSADHLPPGMAIGKTVPWVYVKNTQMACFADRNGTDYYGNGVAQYTDARILETYGSGKWVLLANRWEDDEPDGGKRVRRRWLRTSDIVRVADNK